MIGLALKTKSFTERELSLNLNCNYVVSLVFTGLRDVLTFTGINQNFHLSKNPQTKELLSGFMGFPHYLEIKIYILYILEDNKNELKPISGLGLPPSQNMKSMHNVGGAYGTSSRHCCYKACRKSCIRAEHYGINLNKT